MRLDNAGGKTLQPAACRVVERGGATVFACQHVRTHETIADFCVDHIAPGRPGLHTRLIVKSASMTDSVQTTIASSTDRSYGSGHRESLGFSHELGKPTLEARRRSGRRWFSEHLRDGRTTMLRQPGTIRGAPFDTNGDDNDSDQRQVDTELAGSGRLASVLRASATWGARANAFSTTTRCSLV